ncbi:MAG: HAMP domain-containing protein [Sphingobacterium sp.]|nr:HAMP domain-containing protein [Sphingobacterium sp.]
MIIVFFAGRIFADRALQPVSNIIAQVNGISITNLNERIDEGNGTDELARLAGTFNGMLQRLESAFRIQKNFIANASHELRTPLTVISGQLEVILMKARENEEYRNTIISVLDDIKNLNNLSNRLLLLAQASSEIAEITFSPLRIDDTLWNARTEILKREKEIFN